ncbi:MAG TPA: NADH-quinone oxidoreductase subunit N [Anaerolineales bacterium]|nr:NADH-quinone oxidoreductase subunit N [Anaerolineales bacterium]HRF47197.1 NADH-quinone oxidoreductase subunit N [Anaerolineales bacterium]
MTPNEFIVLLPALTLAAAALVVLLVDLVLPPERKHLNGWLTLIGFAAAALALTTWPAGGSLPAFSGMLVADGLAAFLILIFLIAGAVVTVLALGYLPRFGLERGEAYVLLLLSASGMVLMAQAQDLIMVFLALELLSIPLYVLAGLARPRLASEEAALKYFLLGAFASGILVYGIALVFGATGRTHFAGILAVQVGPQAQVLFDPLLMPFGVALVLAGLGFKIAAAPFHMWTPDVYEGAPSVITAFMSVAVKAAGFVALLRVFVEAFPLQAPLWTGAVAVLAGLTLIVANFAALVQSNVKRMLAYSSIAHAGYLLIAVPATVNPFSPAVLTDAGPVPLLNAEALGAILFYLLSYGLTTLGAWAVVMTIERREADGEAGGLTFDAYRGLWSRRPGLALGMALFMFSLAGLPPTAGFVGKYLVFSAAIEAGLLWLAVLGVITSLVSATYYLRVVVMMFMRPGEPTVAEGWGARLSVVLMAAATLLIGLFPYPVIQLAQRSLAVFVR